MKKFFYLCAAFAVALGMASCTKPAPDGPDGPSADAPTADFSYVVDGLTVTFTDKSANAKSYKWDFGDGETAKEASPKHEYAAAGQYTVKLTVANADGATAKKEESVTVAGKAEAYFTAKALEGREGKFGRLVSFDATGSANAASIEWDFGDGVKGAEFKIDHEYAEYGTYTVKATITGLGGDTDSFEASVELIEKNELLKGGACEEGDEQYWVYTSAEVSAPYDEGAGPMPGVLAWAPTWGYTDVAPALGSKGCLRLSNAAQLHDQSANCMLYQAIDVVEGDILRVSCDMKWGENLLDSGLLWFYFASAPGDAGEVALGGGAVKEMFNYWNAWSEAPIPAYDGNFAGTPDWIAANASMELGFAGDGETPFSTFEVTSTGTIYFAMELRSVWGAYWGQDAYFDNFSVKVY